MRGSYTLIKEIWVLYYKASPKYLNATNKNTNGFYCHTKLIFFFCCCAPFILLTLADSCTILTFWNSWNRLFKSCWPGSLKQIKSIFVFVDVSAYVHTPAVLLLPFTTSFQTRRVFPNLFFFPCVFECGKFSRTLNPFHKQGRTYERGFTHTHTHTCNRAGQYSQLSHEFSSLVTWVFFKH